MDNSIPKSKTCSRCKVEQPLSEFHKYKGRRDGRQNYCKKCCAAVNRNTGKRRRKSGLTYLYYLPEEHYVGITNDVYPRMALHKNAGNITEGYEIIAEYNHRVEAHLDETILHCMGYNGFRDLSKRKSK